MQTFGQGINQTGNGMMSTQGAVPLGNKSINQMPYKAGINDPILQKPKQMGGDFPTLGQVAYQTGSMQNKQGMQSAQSGAKYREDLKDLIPSENW